MLITENLGPANHQIAETKTIKVNQKETRAIIHLIGDKWGIRSVPNR